MDLRHVRSHQNAPIFPTHLLPLLFELLQLLNGLVNFRLLGADFWNSLLRKSRYDAAKLYAIYPHRTVLHDYEGGSREVRNRVEYRPLRDF